MATSKAGSDPENASPSKPEDADESEDESEVLEDSPCGRWQKRREEVSQRDVPGIDSAFLAMDTEEGVEVVWNEVRISEKKASKGQLVDMQEKIRQVLDNLTQLDHTNIVKFHSYWTDATSDHPRLIFITEYMSSGSLKQFLKKTKKNNKNLRSLKQWKKWCTQILSALSYLHSCDPPIIHANLTTETIFIQHNGLIKIGCVAPDAFYKNVKTRKAEAKNMHYVAPEYAGVAPVTTAIDIYAFGICALEMVALEIAANNGDTGHRITEELINKTIASLEDPLLKDFIVKCLNPDPHKRPSARDLLLHPVLFEVHSLCILSAHSVVKSRASLPENLTDESYHDPAEVVAEINFETGRKPVYWTRDKVQTLELEKFLEDIKNGVYPLTAFATIVQPQHTRPRAVSPELAESVKSETPEPVDTEMRMITAMTCVVRPSAEDSLCKQITLTLKMDDKMNRQLSTELADEDTPHSLAEELVHLGFINQVDSDRLEKLIDESLQSRSLNSSPASQLIMQSA